MLGAAACFNKANAVKDSAGLIKLVKAAANHKVRLSAIDTIANSKVEAIQ
jgi:hypothetical protein